MASVPVYVDTCVFVEVLQRDNQARLAACDELIARASRDELLLVTSAITITETNRLPNSPALPEEQSKQIVAFFMNPYIAIRPVTRQVAEAAHELTRTHRLTNLDAIHVATAIASKVSVLYTYDNPKSRRKGLMRLSNKVGAPPLAIDYPPDVRPEPSSPPAP